MSTTEPIRNGRDLEKFRNYYRDVKPNARNHLLIIMGLNTALRISDVLSLTYGDVYDYERKRWRTHLTVREQKTGKENRVYINQEIKKALADMDLPMLHAQEDVLFPGRRKDKTENAVHMHSGMHENKDALSRFQAYRVIREAAQESGLSGNISCHSLRKTFGYHAWKQGVPPVMLMDIYNHSSYQITKRYLGISQEDKDDVFRRVQL